MIADVTGTPVEVPKGSEFGAKGAALLAATAIGWFSSVAEACQETFVLDRRHEPDRQVGTGYESAYARYRACSAGTLDAIAPAYR
jgi:sugar (pentulose or hexulose) kinase